MKVTVVLLVCFPFYNLVIFMHPLRRCVGMIKQIIGNLVIKYYFTNELRTCTVMGVTERVKSKPKTTTKDSKSSCSL